MSQFRIHVFRKFVSMLGHLREYFIAVAYGLAVRIFFRAVLQVREIASDNTATALDAYSPALKVRVFICVAGDVFVFHGCQDLVYLTSRGGNWFNNMQGEQFGGEKMFDFAWSIC